MLAGVLFASGCGSKKQGGESPDTDGSKAVSVQQTAEDAPADSAGADAQKTATQPETETEFEAEVPMPSSQAEQEPETAKAASEGQGIVIPQMMGVSGTHPVPSDTGETGNSGSEDPGTQGQAPDGESQVQPSEAEAQPRPSVSTEDYTQVSETVYTTVDVNVRSGPGTDYEKVGALYKGAAVTRTGIGESWSRVIYENAEAFISSEFLTTEPPQTEAETTAEGEFWSGDIAAIQALSNRIFTGCADESSRDAKNIPNGCYYLTKLYHKYHADFIRDTNQNIIYLTMDEGYEAGYTPTILQTLRDKNVKAVFFVTKQFYDSHPELIQEMINDGHVIGNHTCAHPSDGMPAHDLEWQGNDIMTLHNLVKDRFGYEMKLFRFPAGLTSEQSMAYVASLGYTSVFWSFAYVDYDRENQMDPAVALEQCVNYLHPGAIYLLHAVSSTNTEILGQFIDEARARGFEFGVYPVS